MPTSEAYNMDCLEYMRTLPDNAFDLLIADPPYGDGSGKDTDGLTERETVQTRTGPERQTAGRDLGRCKVEKPYNRFGQRFDRYKHNSVMSTGGVARQGQLPSRSDGAIRTGGTWAEKYGKKIIAWDVAPGKEYFDELFRVSRNQIIWGGNYFALPPTRCFLVWRKLSISESFTMAMAEYAWTSFNENAKVFEHVPQGKPGDRFHPTQKPVALYKWILSRYAKPGDKIFDPYLGSGSSRIAAWDIGFDFVGCEIDKVYFDLMEKRFKEHISQTRMEL